MPDTLASRQAAPATLSKVPAHRCAACGAPGGAKLAELHSVPTNSCLMLPSAEAARAWPRGDIALFLCESCGFIANRAFAPELTEYSDRYEPSQGWSGAFRRYHRDLALRIAAAVPLAGKRVVEIGCGQGEFLHLLCSATGASGQGFDPCVDPRRADVVERRTGDVRLVPAFFDEVAAATQQADLLVCKMTLEHIPAVGRFAALCAQVARNSAPGMRLFVQVPDSLRILREVAIEDIYYEHCCYFTEAALRGLFARHGFATDAVYADYDGQYLGLLARHVGAAPAAPGPLAEVARLGAGFAAAHDAKLAAWRRRIAGAGRVALWGSGSKGVAFLAALGRTADAVMQVVDINPHRQGMFMIGSGHPIVAPAALAASRPDTVVVMNRVYREEIAATLAGLGLSPRLLAL
ncbi:class I SAM-dependent methyltransferase [Falsiroseomonas oryzae]|uniref:class I SAM-dependent methyltransferase n=1 Tax=Falsiroseomonas oryzae TaxID=2766473 RepID=UPI0022EA1DC7|nr:class I SAM-dependent methyltransferase [Roseomonas sp. MO-31]